MHGRASLLGMLALVSAPAGAATLRIPEDYPTVADAVAAAAAGDVIEVGEGTFAGSALIDIDLTITGAGEGLTVLDGGTGTILEVVGASLTVSDLTLASELTGGFAVDLMGSVAAFEAVTFQGAGVPIGYIAVYGRQSDLSLSECTFSDIARPLHLEQGALDSVDTDYAVSDAGGIFVMKGQATLTGGSIVGNPNGSLPASISFYYTPATLSGVTLDSVELNGSEAPLTLSDSTVTGTDGWVFGYPDLVVERTRFEDLTTGSLLLPYGTLTLEDSVFVNCDAYSLVSGELSPWIEARRNLISNSTFDVAITSSSGELLFEGNTLSDNEGTFLEFDNNVEITVVGNELVRNVAPGALIYQSSGSPGSRLEVRDNVFRDNRGSAMVEWNNGHVTIEHNLFAGTVLEPLSTYTGVVINTAYIATPNDEAQIVQNTFAGTEGPGAVVGSTAVPLEVRNNLVVGHSGPSPAVVGHVNLSHNLLWDNAGGDLPDGQTLPSSNLSADPLFDTRREGPSTAQDLVLLPGSPAIDAGHPDILDADGSPSDIGYTGGPVLDPLLQLDADGDGSSARFDCDDEDGAVFPGQVEVCGDGVDSDCDGAPDQGLVYADADGDGWGDPSISFVLDICTLDAYPIDSVSVLGTDCDDSDPNVGAPVDTWPDQDLDGFGAGEPSLACPGERLALVGGDCDDADGAVSPSGLETCDGRDEDCDGEVDEGACTGPGPMPPIRGKSRSGCGCDASGAPRSLGLLGALGVLALARRRVRPS